MTVNELRNFLKDIDGDVEVLKSDALFPLSTVDSICKIENVEAENTEGEFIIIPKAIIIQ